MNRRKKKKKKDGTESLGMVTKMDYQ